MFRVQNNIKIARLYFVQYNLAKRDETKHVIVQTNKTSSRWQRTQCEIYPKSRPTNIQ